MLYGWIWKKGTVHQDINASTKSYKTEVQWWRPTSSFGDMKELYQNCLNKNQQRVTSSKQNMFIDVNRIIWAWSPREIWERKKFKINEKGLAAVRCNKNILWSIWVLVVSMEVEGFYSYRDILFYTCCGCISLLIFIIYIGEMLNDILYGPICSISIIILI